MENITTENNKKLNIFLESLLSDIRIQDALNAKKLEANVYKIAKEHKQEYYNLLNLVYAYFRGEGLTSKRLAEDYLKMIKDMRGEGLHFLRSGNYSCQNQQEAYAKVYSNNEIMSYYMNALLLSQILWVHHFEIFCCFSENLNNYFSKDSSKPDILDIGPGHGFFSYIAKNKIKNFNRLDLVDISETSLTMTKKILNDGPNIRYTNKDVFDFQANQKYDFIILGEVLEHLDQPGLMLKKVANLLNDLGILWLTIPTNAPAIDHVHLFRTKEEIFDMVTATGFNVIDSFIFNSEDVSDEIAEKNKITQLVGIFANKKQS